MANGDCSLLVRPWERTTTLANEPNEVGAVIVAERFLHPWSEIERGLSKGSATGLGVIKVRNLAVGVARRRLVAPVYAGFELVDPVPPAPEDPGFSTWRPPKKRARHRRWKIDFADLRSRLGPAKRAQLGLVTTVDGVAVPLAGVLIVRWSDLRPSLRNRAGAAPASDWMVP